MISKIIKLSFIVSFLVLPQIVLAQVGYLTPSTGSISLTPSLLDYSVGYLGQIFGTVGTVLHGTSGQLLGTLFYVFNLGILVLAGIFLIYTIILTIINTAQEGEFMGRKFNAAWVALRTVLGLGLLVPSPITGYSTIQVIVMWVVLQGIGFANLAWGQALQYLGTGGNLYTPPAANTSSMIDLAGTVLSAQVCMYKAQDVLAKNLAQQQKASQGQQSNAQQTNYVSNFSPLFTYVTGDSLDSAKLVVKFPGNPYPSDGTQDSACGEIMINQMSDSDFNGAQSKLDNDQSTQTIKAALQQVILDTDTVAKDIAIPPQTPSSNFDQQAQSALVGAAADWINITIPLRTAGGSIGDVLMLGYWQTSLQEGWIMAGRYYFALGLIQSAVNQLMNVNVTLLALPAGFTSPTDKSAGSYISFYGPPQIDTTQMDPAHTFPGLRGFTDDDRGALRQAYLNGASYVTEARALSQQVDMQNFYFSLNIGSAGILGFLLDPIGTVMTYFFAQIVTAVGDPILILQGIGYSFLGLATSLWLLATVALFALGIPSALLSSANPLPWSIQYAVLAFIPTFTAVILTFWVLGGTFAYYVPFIPFIIYVFAAIGWFISVIEAMVAAPLVALGITHPEGHDLLGKSEQAVMLLLSVFLRPVLMIIGLFAGMILSRVVLRFINAGYFGIMFDVGQYNPAGAAAPAFTIFTFLSMIVVYSMILITVVQQSFSLIYLVPDRVMRWLGVSEQTTGVQEALQAAKGGFEQVGGAAKELSGGMAPAAKGMKKGLAKDIGEKEAKGKKI